MIELSPGSRILVCDDERHILRLIKVRLERQGHQVTSATTGREAMELLDGQAFDVAILDPHLPDMNGYEIREWALMQQHLAEMRVIMLDGKAQDSWLR